LDAILAALPDQTFHVDETGRFLDFCVSCPSHSAPAHDQLGLRLDQILPTPARKAVGAALRAAREQNRIQTVAYDLPDESQGQRRYEVRLLPTGGGQCRVVVGEVTERVRADEAAGSVRELLEQRLAERTTRLRAANRRLRAEIQAGKRTAAALRQSETRARRAEARLRAVVDGGSEEAQLGAIVDNLPGVVYRRVLHPTAGSAFLTTARGTARATASTPRRRSRARRRRSALCIPTTAKLGGLPP
jgi:hypothetical protein